jgi:hypothetical protein
MADALCGPANPLASFQKHTQVDRTLQQDRLTGLQHSPSQGFRSSDPRAEHLDADFAAFEAGRVDPVQFQQQFQPPTFHHAPQAPSLSNWAADFQKLQVSELPIPAHQFRAEAPLLRNGLGGWQNEFMKQRQNGVSPVVLGKQPERAMQTNTPTWSPVQQPGFLEQPMWSSYQPYQSAQLPFQEAVYYGPQQHGHEEHMEMNDADFEAAFSEAQQEIQEQHTIPQETLDRMAETEARKFFADHQLLHSDGTYTNDHSDQNINTDRPGLFDTSQRIGSDAINYAEQKDRSAEQDTRDADDLARTAGQLLNSVQHDSSDKFRESRFLDLMRRIRDREVEVRGEDFVDTSTQGTENNITPLYTNKANESSIPSTYEAREKDPLTPQPEPFTFPDLNEVYNPQNTDTDYHFDTHNPSSSTPMSQIQELHPGGRNYPEQSPPPMHTMMSGGISTTGTSTSYKSTTVEDLATISSSG